MLGNVLLLVAGTLVGASGTILTRLMAAAMGRTVVSIVFGAFRGGSTAGATAVGDRRCARPAPTTWRSCSTTRSKVVVVPGYGLAVAQAQHTIRELADLLESRGVEVLYGIHPVAGRMPGHMNVLLAEANVPVRAAQGDGRGQPRAAVDRRRARRRCQRRREPGGPDDAGRAHLRDADHRRRPGAAVVFLKRSMRPGFAGIENELLYNAKTSLLFGDAKDSLTKVVQALKAL